MTISYADEQRALHRLEFEKARLVIDAATELKLALEDAGLSKSDLARLLGKTRSIVTRQLNGHENLSLGKLVELALAVGKRVELSLVSAGSRAQSDGRPGFMKLVWAQPASALQNKTVRINVPDGEPLKQSDTSRDRATKHETAA